MAESSSVALSSEMQSQIATATTKLKSSNWQDVDKLFSRLTARHANPKVRDDDPLTAAIQKLLNINEDIKLLRENAEELIKITQDFIDSCNNFGRSQNIYDEFEFFQNQMNRWKPTHKLFTLTNADFDFDRRHSLENNEAVLQRTLLTSILDRWRLNEMFTFTCETHWRNTKHNPLPVKTGQDSNVGGLKADLVLFYRTTTFTGYDADSDADIPNIYEKYTFPDGVTERCFPFIFIEAKKGQHDLTYAIYNNMLTASQALWNMYKWMCAGGQEELFFQHVRVFSISLNAEKLVARVHRAERLPNPEQRTKERPNPPLLKFLWDVLYVETDYTRNQVSLLIRNLLLEYGVVRLRGYLGQAAKKIIGQEFRPLEQMDIWKLPEVRDAVQRTKAVTGQSTQAEPSQAVTAMDVPETISHAEGNEETSVPASATRPGPSKRTAAGRNVGRAPKKRATRQKERMTEAPIDPSSSFGASHMTINDGP